MPINPKNKKRLFFVLVLSLLLLAAVLVRLFLVTTYRVKGDAMLPTYQSGKLLWINLLASPDRGDIVVIKHQKEGEKRASLYLARLIGLPGDSLYISSKGVKVNNQKLEVPPSLLPAESYGFILPQKNKAYRLTPLSLIPCRGAIEQECKDKVIYTNGRLYKDGVETSFFFFNHNYYWLLTDNPKSGPDSRHLGIIPEESIVGVVMGFSK